jgi:hypothetical protein
MRNWQQPAARLLKECSLSDHLTDHTVRNLCQSGGRYGRAGVVHVHATDRGRGVVSCAQERAYDSAFVSPEGAAGEGPCLGSLSRLCLVGDAKAPTGSVNRASFLDRRSRQRSAFIPRSRHCLCCPPCTAPISNLPTTDGREIRLRRSTEPIAEQKSLLHQLSLSLPERLKSLSKCSAGFTKA